MQLIAILSFINCFAYIPYSSVQALGRPDLKAIEDVLTLPVYAIAAWWLMTRMGINGAALAKLIVTALDCSVLYMFAYSLKAFRFRDLLSGTLLRALTTSVGLAVSVFLVHALCKQVVV